MEERRRCREGEKAAARGGDPGGGPERGQAERAKGPDLVYITHRYVKPKAEDGLGEGKGR